MVPPFQKPGDLDLRVSSRKRECNHSYQLVMESLPVRTNECNSMPVCKTGHSDLFQDSPMFHFLSFAVLHTTATTMHTGKDLDKVVMPDTR